MSKVRTGEKRGQDSQPAAPPSSLETRLSTTYPSPASTSCRSPGSFPRLRVLAISHHHGGGPGAGGLELSPPPKRGGRGQTAPPIQVPILEASDRPCPCLQAACPEREGLPGPRRGSPQTSGHIPPPPAYSGGGGSSQWGQGLLLVLDSNLRPAPHTPGVVPDRVSPALYPEMQLPELFLESDWPGHRPGCGCQPLGLLGLLLSLRARLGLAPT